jgi:pyruvate kinase
VNLPGAQLAGSALTAKDKRDLAFGLEQGVDAVAVSFVQSARDITAVRRLIGRRPVIVIAKIEHQEALNHIDEINAAADGIMVARGDLGIELKIGQVPVWQKQIIDRCRTAGKPVIVATQMLESMMSHWRPTRAEASDVANAVMDHADAVMLSEETAVGEFPVETVRTMSHIIKQAEVSTYDDVQLADSLPTSTAEAQAMHLAHLARVPTVRAILIQAHDLNDLVPLLRFRPAIRIIVLTSSVIVQRQLSLVWGVIAYHMTSAQSITALLKQARTYAAPRSSARSSDQVVIVTTQPRVTILVD